MSLDNILCIIPARGGSKGIPNKNIRTFDGYPLFCWSVAAALQSKCIDRIVVSSDIIDIDKIYEQYCKRDSRIEWVKRPDHLCTDSATTESCLCHAINHVGKDKFKYAALLQPTSPFRKKQMIDDAFRCLLQNKKNTLLSAKPHSPFFLQRLSGGDIKWHYNRLDRKMRQDLGKYDLFWYDDGNLYIFDVDVLMSTNCRLDHSPYIYENDELASKQIDTELDFVILEKMRQELTYKDKYISP